MSHALPVVGPKAIYTVALTACSSKHCSGKMIKLKMFTPTLHTVHLTWGVCSTLQLLFCVIAGIAQGVMSQSTARVLSRLPARSYTDLSLHGALLPMTVCVKSMHSLVAIETCGCSVQQHRLLSCEVDLLSTSMRLVF